uniref:Reverse transcriptase domain-containing protein n=1 Tax=Glossina austeni TaxID=7395 RepID=A0A1A9VNJ5_GLOAU
MLLQLNSFLRDVKHIDWGELFACVDELESTTFPNIVREQREWFSLVALNLSKAFNNVNHRGLIMKLAGQFGFSKSACKLVYSHLSGQVRVSTTCRVYAGVNTKALSVNPRSI